MVRIPDNFTWPDESDADPFPKPPDAPIEGGMACTPLSLGANTACTWVLYWDGAANGFAGEVADAVGIVRQPSLINNPCASARFPVGLEHGARRL